MNETVIVSTGRCGSTLLSDLINQHPDVLSLSEFFTCLGGARAFGYPTLTGRALWSKVCRRSRAFTAMQAIEPVPEILADTTGDFPEPLEMITIPHLAQNGPGKTYLREVFRNAVEAQPEQTVHEHYQAIFEHVARAMSKPHWVERSGGSLAYAGDLIKAFPKARFIHIHRDGPSTAMSLAKHPYFRVPMAYQLLAEPVPMREAMGVTVPPYIAGRSWSEQIVEGLGAILKHAPDTLHVSYEQLCEDPQTEVARVFEFLGVEPEWINTDAIREPTRRYSVLPFAEQVALTEACEPGTRFLKDLSGMG